MNHDHERDHEVKDSSGSQSWLFSRTGVATIVAISVLGFLVYTGHSAHLLGALPYLLILSCPLMHIFMHGSHHGGSHTQKKEPQDDNQDQHKSHGGHH